MPAKRIDPTVRLFDPSKKTQLEYTHSTATDIGKRFAAIRRAQAKAEREAAAAERAAAQQPLELESAAQVLPLFKQAV